MRSILWGLGLLTSTACDGVFGGRGGICDQAALRKAAGATDAVMTAWRSADGAMPDYRVAVRGLREACPRLPAGFHGYLEYSVQPLPDLRGRGFDLGTPLRDDPEALRPLRAHCPALAAVTESLATLPASERRGALYDACDFARIGLYSRAELPDTMADPQGHHGHALYLWLVDDGAPPEVARALVRPILAGTDTTLEVFRDLARLPAARRGAAPSWFSLDVRVALDGVTANSKRLVQLEQGRLAEADHSGELIGTVFDTLVEEVDKTRALASDQGATPGPARIVIAADPRLPWATVGAVAYTARRAGHDIIDAYALAPDPLHPLITLPLYASGEAPTLELTLTAAAIVLRCKGGESTPALDALAAALDRCGGGPMRMTIAPDTSWQRVIAVAAELAGHAAVVDLASPHEAVR